MDSKEKIDKICNRLNTEYETFGYADILENVVSLYTGNNARGKYKYGCNYKFGYVKGMKK